ncbi:hypothetical protein BM531_20975, partial [Clostridioides difficile]
DSQSKNKSIIPAMIIKLLIEITSAIGPKIIIPRGIKPVYIIIGKLRTLPSICGATCSCNIVIADA